MHFSDKQNSNIESEAVQSQLDERPWSMPVKKNFPDKSKKATPTDRIEAISGQTIHPEITHQINDGEKSTAPDLKDSKIILLLI